MTTTHSISPETRATTSIALIAQREITTRVRTRSFVATTAILMIVIIAGLIVWSVFSGGGDSKERIGLVGNDSTLTAAITAVGDQSGTPVTVVTLASTDQARDRVADGDLEAVVVTGPNSSYTLISKDGIEESLSGVLRGAIAQTELARGLAARNVDATTLPQPSISMSETEPADPAVGQRIVVAIVGSMLLITAIMMGGNMIAVGVVEEKTSRIVELLLATIKPLHLMWGKIIGIGVVALGQMVLLGITALIAGTATGMLTIAGTALGMFAAVLIWFLLGFVFFATLYAAAGAMVSRQEEIGSTITPLTILSLAVMYSGIFGIQALDSTFIQTLSWIPPFSSVLIPIRIATGDTDPVQIVVSLLLMVAACVIATWLAAKVYQRSILRTGSRVKWGEALRLSR
ncbi:MULTISPECIES: ABC transporter permease [unclassified Gordonia (in: high G+C Gram-positive bacteria)]|uniref:ABC transporter permease n=1 Tax=unclassified Gordonia (in: high G+C Gram-positive bacteria) TaxID=2657482 RepID=UPI001F0F5A44|nr:ABC transporter permease [Gordonia sp. ABSL49_1]MCH5643159.1 ABC transporter permease [Gordonia sp. ABSL49_1]